MSDTDKRRGIVGRALSGREVTGRELGMRSVTAGGKLGSSTPAPAATKRNVILVMRAG